FHYGILIEDLLSLCEHTVKSTHRLLTSHPEPTTSLIENIHVSNRKLTLIWQTFGSAFNSDETGDDHEDCRSVQMLSALSRRTFDGLMRRQCRQFAGCAGPATGRRSEFPRSVIFKMVQNV